MTPAPRPPSSTKSLARRAAITLLVTATLGLLIGGLCVLMSVMLPRFADNPDVRNMLDEMRQQTKLEPAIAMRAEAVIFLGYAAFGLTIGLGLFTASRRWVLAGMIFCSAAGGLVVVNGLASLAQGSAGGFIVAALAAVPHALALWWLLQTRTAPAVAVVLTPPPAYRAMQDYYLPAVEPENRRAAN